MKKNLQKKFPFLLDSFQTCCIAIFVCNTLPTSQKNILSQFDSVKIKDHFFLTLHPSSPHLKGIQIIYVQDQGDLGQFPFG